MKKVPALLFFVFLLFLISDKNVFASSISLASDQAQISDGDEYIVNFNLSVNANDGTQYYLRGEIFRSGTSSYCGFTWNGSSWFNGPYTSNNGWLNLLPVVVQSSSASGQLKTKIDISDSSCNSSGTYNFRIQRYTQSGNPSSDEQTPLQVQVVVTVPTPTPTPMPTFTPTPNPTSTSTSTPTSTPIATKTPKPTINSRATSKPLATDSSSQVLAARDQLKPSATPLVMGEKTEKRFPLVAGLLVVFGVVFVGFASLPFIKMRLKGYNFKYDSKVEEGGNFKIH